MTAPAPHHAPYMRLMHGETLGNALFLRGLSALAIKKPCFAGVLGLRRIILAMGTLFKAPAGLPVTGTFAPVLLADRLLTPCTQPETYQA